MGFRIHVENFRILRSADWSPDGVCALVGPNGAGKSTFLHAFEFLHHVLDRGPKAAIELAGGAAMLRHLAAPPEEETAFTFQMGETRWEVHFRVVGAGIQWPFEERLWAGSELLVEQEADGSLRAMGMPIAAAPEAQSAIIRAVPFLENSKRRGFATAVAPILDYGYFHTPQIRQLRTVGSRNGSDVTLDSAAENLFTVLRNWQAGARQDRERVAFVKAGLTEAFPDLFEDLDFEAAGQTVTARFYMPRVAQPIPIHLAPNGLLVAMCHLAAVASAETGGIVAIDEVENSLHPHAIRVLVERMRERAAQKELTVILATHSPVVLNQFNEDPAHVFVIEAGRSPMRLDEHENPDWLRQFALGDLYANEEIGAPRLPA